jgi:hypothetical protein
MMSADWRRKLLTKLKRWCQDRWPVPYPVRVYLRPTSQMENHLGYFLYDEDNERGLIAIDASLQRNEMIDTFMEEWAHARTSHLVDTEETSDDPWHHPSFWSEYGRLVKACRERAW